MMDVDRAELDHYLTAAVVFGRSAFHYLEKAAEMSTDRPYRQWFAARALAVKADVLLEHFRDIRNTEIHARRVPLSRHVNLNVNAVLRISVYGEGRVIRGQPWYRRTPRIWWQDTSTTVLRPLRRWRYQFGEWLLRRRAALEARMDRVRARFRKPARVTVMEFFFEDPEGLNRPAVTMIDAYLSRWEGIVNEAESKFPHVFGV